jgi:hypothetical protein
VHGRGKSGLALGLGLGSTIDEPYNQQTTSNQQQEGRRVSAALLNPGVAAHSVRRSFV